MASSEITFYDLSRKARTRCWSFNPWKTPARLILNYKNIPLTTHFLEMPDIAAHHTALSIPPNSPGSSTLLATPYTVPTIRPPATLTVPNSNPNSTNSNTNPTPISNKSPADEYIMDSALIAQKLESLYPSPPSLSTPKPSKPSIRK